MKQQGLHWYPGHMQKAFRQIEERLPLIDVIVEVVDSRLPLSSKNPFLEIVTSNKKRLIVMSKKDLTNLNELEPFIKYYKDKNYEVVVADLNSKSDIEKIKASINSLGKDKREREIKRGLKPQPLRAMIIGIPNVGKSTLINRLSKRASMSVANTPGHTRSQQWLKVDSTLELLDTPGILPPHYEDKKYALNLALTGAMKVENISSQELVENLLDIGLRRFKKELQDRYDIEVINNPSDVIEGIARRRGLILQGGNLDLNKAENLLLKEFKEGLIVKLVLDELC